MDYKEKYEQALGRAKALYAKGAPDSLHLEEMFPELKESENNRIRKNCIHFLELQKQHHAAIFEIEECITWLEKQGEIINEYEDKLDRCACESFDKGYKAALEKQSEQKPNFCHHEVDLSGCSEEYRKAYYDGWNNCNQQHSQLKVEQKPAWSEEDEKILETLINDTEKILFAIKQEEIPDIMSGLSEIYIERLRWLKSLKERIKRE